MSNFRSIPISSVVAVTPSFGIGMKGTLPWKAAGVALPGDMEYFKKITTRTSNNEMINAVVMGRLTWEGKKE